MTAVEIVIAVVVYLATVGFAICIVRSGDTRGRDGAPRAPAPADPDRRSWWQR